MTAEELHKQVERLLATEPPAWHPKLGHWIAEADCPGALDVESQRYYQYLRALVELLQPKTVLELGTCLGGSACFMMLALPEGSTLTTVDVDGRHPWQLEPFCSDHRLRRVIGNDLSLDIYGASVPSSIDLLFIDTIHEYDQVKRELALYLPLMTPCGVIVFDDIHLNCGMELMWSELPLEKVDTGSAYHWSGFGVALANTARLTWISDLRACL